MANYKSQGIWNKEICLSRSPDRVKYLNVERDAFRTDTKKYT